eukprot:850952-Ditylum_brightwellii.AAC.1
MEKIIKMLYLLEMTLLCDMVWKIIGVYMQLFSRKTALNECLNGDSFKSLQVKLFLCRISAEDGLDSD